MPANELPPVESQEYASHAVAVQDTPDSLSELLARHGSDPNADSRTRIPRPVVALVLADLHVALGLVVALAAVMFIGPTAHPAWNAFGFGIASAAAVLALRRPGRIRGTADLAISLSLCGLVAAIAGVGMSASVISDGHRALIIGGLLMAGLAVTLFGLHRGHGLPARLARVCAPVVPLAAALSASF